MGARGLAGQGGAGQLDGTGRGCAEAVLAAVALPPHPAGTSVPPGGRGAGPARAEPVGWLLAASCPTRGRNGPPVGLAPSVLTAAPRRSRAAAGKALCPSGSWEGTAPALHAVAGDALSWALTSHDTRLLTGTGEAQSRGA